MKERTETQKLWTRCLWLLLIPVGLLTPGILTGRSDWVERVYCASVYPAVVRALSAVTSMLPFSVAELILYGLAAILLFGLARLIWDVWSKRARLTRLLSHLISAGILFGVLLNLFYVTWGMNYFRAPLSARMALDVRERSVQELAALTERLAGETNALRETLPEDENGVFQLQDGTQDMLDSLPAAYKTLAGRLPIFAGGVTRAKRVLWSEGLSYLGIAGIYIGFTAEPNINAHQPDLLLPQGAAHEMAHQLGIAAENEAEFAAHLACLASVDPCVRYSGMISALLTCGNALHRADAALYREILAAYSPAVMRDLDDYRVYWDAHEGKLSEVQDEWNDAYLKHNQQESGVQSYGESVDLLLAWYDQTNS